MSKKERESRVDSDRSAAERYRLEQARELLRECGYVEGADGKWRRPDASPEESEPPEE